MSSSWIHRRQFLQSTLSAPAAAIGQARVEKPEIRESLAAARTTDGLDLAGLMLEGVGRAAHVAVLWIHGASGNFYVPTYLAIGRAMAARGIPFLSANTRMHDIGSDLSFGEGGDRRGGAYWGLPSKEPDDIAAWVELLSTRGYSRVVLVGHSAGGAGARRFVAERQDNRVVGLALASVALGPAPPRPTPEQLRTADDMLAAGRGQEFVPAIRMSAQTFSDYAHTPDDMWDFYGSRGTVSPGISRVRCHLLAWFGSDDVGSTTHLEELRALIGRQATRPRSVTTRMIDGTDHLYRGATTRVADLLGEWIAVIAKQ